ncbi:hypothetical protein BM449_00440 [Synechococcus sp. SynAce01]|nr:hypothetical protein BM449_00440 [Synechococcus sp. SynAce01]
MTIRRWWFSRTKQLYGFFHSGLVAHEHTLSNKLTITGVKVMSLDHDPRHSLSLITPKGQIWLHTEQSSQRLTLIGIWYA